MWNENELNLHFGLKSAVTQLFGQQCIYPWSRVFTSPPEEVARYCFHPVCVCVCRSVCVSVCPANILIFYCSATRRDIDLKFIQDTYRVVLDPLKKLTFIGQGHRDGTLLFEGTAISQKLSHRHLLGYSIRWNNKNWSEQRNDVTKNTSIFDCNMYNSHTKITNSHKIVNKDLKNMAVIQPGPTHILYQCAKFGDDRTSFNVIFDVCDV